MMLRSPKNNQKGAALAVVLIVLMVISILAVPFISVSGQEQMNAIRQEQSAKAYYIALAGAEAVAHQISNYPTKAVVLSSSGKSNKTSFGGGSFEVNVTNPSGQVNIVSEGTYGSRKKTVTILMSASSGSSIFENAIFSEASLTLGAMKKVTGPLESKGTINIDGLPDRGINPEAPKPLSKRVFPPPVFPTGAAFSTFLTDITDTATISVSGKYHNIDLGNQALTFDTSAGPLQVVVDTFITKGDIIITGGNRLELYINNEFNVQTKLDVNPPPNEASNLLVFLKANSVVYLTTGQSSFYGYIYGPEASVQQFSGAGVKGAIIVGSFVGESSATLEFLPFTGTYDITPIVTTYSIDSYN